MQAHYLQHVPFESLGSIEPWLLAHNYQITHTPLFVSTDFPGQETIDMLFILGGPMSVNNEADHPWLLHEKAFIRAYLKTGKPMLGICLGAQLIANTLGASVYANTEKEIGWFPINAIPASAIPENSDCFSFPDNLTVFHWHGETFDLPASATLLASSAACKNQAFQIGTNVIGLQFHLETTPAAAQNLATHCHNEIIPAPYAQTADQILSATTAAYGAINREMARILAYLLQQS